MKAFILRIAPSEIDHFPEALKSNELIIGWSKALGLLDPSLDWYQFRKILHDYYHSGDKDYTRSGRSAGNIWRFIREMNEGDLVVVPYGSDFYIARVTGPAYHDASKIDDDTAYRRSVEWLNGRTPIPRRFALATLQSRMKIRQTCVNASDLIDEIQDALKVGSETGTPSFESDLRRNLILEAHKQICSGRLDSFAFERLVATILTSLGGKGVRIVPRNLDKGVDILAVFSLAHTFKFTLGVQARHYYKPEPPLGASVIDYLWAGMEAEGVSFGWVVTAGSFSQEAVDRKAEIEEKQGVQIELIDGEQLAAMVIDSGLGGPLVSPLSHSA
ncbi:MAG: restriction endonuclease [Thermodesulfobacteriota bacterium]|nr:restriction endonuclease [Thermodesulfobacteriota bacterium]